MRPHFHERHLHRCNRHILVMRPEPRKLIAGYKMKSAMSRKADCCDNHVTETLFGLRPVERLHRMRLNTH
jgi:hypothetical protein